MYIYPYREKANIGIELNPNSMIVEGSLVVPVPEDTQEVLFEIRVLPLEIDKFKITAGIGSKK
jgi:hypothetical protein